MATDTDVRGETVDGFGRVSQTAGIVFRYVLLASTLLGIVALGVLLAYVANDAIQPFTADGGWFLVYFVTLVAPTTAVGWWLSRRDGRALSVGATTLGIPAIGLLFGAGVAAVFIDVLSPLVWFAYYVALAVPLAVAVGVNRSDVDLPFLGWVALALLALVLSLAFVPGFVLRLPYVPTDGMSMALTFGVPAAAIAGSYVGDRRDDVRIGYAAGAIALGATAAASIAGLYLIPELGQIPAAVLMATAGVPTGAYVAGVVARRPADRVGFLFPVVLVVGALLGASLVDAAGFAGPNSWIDWQFLTNPHYSNADEAGIYPAIVGSVLLMFIVALVSFPLGVGAAVYLEEYAPDNRYTRLIKINISNLAGVPSVVYGLLGLGAFVTYLGPGIPVLPPSVAGPLGLEPVYFAGNLFGSGTVVVGGLTLSLLILPIIIISAQEAIRAVPDDLRQASYGMGATRWQTVRSVVLPRAIPGILTGTILALGRAIGETAPLLMIGAANVADLPRSLNASVTAMPLQIYAWSSLFAGKEFWTKVVPAGVVVLLVAMLAMNSVAIALRNRYQRER